MANISKKCLECGVEFFKPVNRSNKDWAIAKYCSQKCSIKNTSVQKQDFDRNRLKGHRPWNKNMKGIQPWMNLSGLEKGRGLFKGKSLPQMEGRNNPKWVEPIKVNCEYCRKELFLKPNQVRTKNFCNRTCWALGTRGRGSPVYKGEKSVARLRNRIAQLPEYRQWHAEILKRDGYKCFICDSKKDLEVHHIKRFLIIANKYAIITPEDARKCAELWDVNNGRTLCRICHRTTDTYGTKGTKKLST